MLICYVMLMPVLSIFGTSASLHAMEAPLTSMAIGVLRCLCYMLQNVRNEFQAFCNVCFRNYFQNVRNEFQAFFNFCVRNKFQNVRTEFQGALCSSCIQLCVEITTTTTPTSDLSWVRRDGLISIHEIVRVFFFFF